MNFQYNDYVYLLTVKKNNLAKFMCYRPDKNKAIIEADNRITHCNISEMRKASVKEVNDYFNFNIKRANEAIKEANDDAKDYTLKLAGAKTKLHKRRLEMNALSDQILQLSTALQLLGEDNYDYKMAKQLEELGKEEEILSRTIDSFNNTIEYLSNNLQSATSNKNEWTAVKNNWKEEKRNYLEGLNNDKN